MACWEYIGTSHQVLDSKGQTTLYYFIKGNVYVTDPTKTTWHSTNKRCMLDYWIGSIRQWDTSGRVVLNFK